MKRTIPAVNDGDTVMDWEHPTDRRFDLVAASSQQAPAIKRVELPD